MATDTGSNALTAPGERLWFSTEKGIARDDQSAQPCAQ